MLENLTNANPPHEGAQDMPCEEAAPQQLQLSGLLVRGRVERRVRRIVGEQQTEVITYTLGPRSVQVEDWRPTDYYGIGEVVELPVEVGVYNGRPVIRRSSEQEF